MKKGSVSLFIILGIVLLVILIASFSFIPSVPVVASGDVKTVRAFLSSCIEESGEFALFVMGRQGGHIVPPSPAHWEPYGVVGFAFYDHENHLPSEQQMQMEISGFMQVAITQCANSFEAFDAQGIDIESDDVHVQTSFSEKEVRMVVDYPLKVRSEERITELDPFSHSFPVRIRYIHESLDTLLERKQDDPAFWDISYLESLELNSTFLIQENGDELLILTDEGSKLNHEPYKFILAAKGGEIV